MSIDLVDLAAPALTRTRDPSYTVLGDIRGGAMAEKTFFLPIAKGKEEISILARMANRHGLIAGATGTGKTVTLRVLAEAFSGIGVPVFMADIKGDLSGLPLPGGENPKVLERVKQLKLKNFTFEGYPVVFWDVFGE